MDTINELVSININTRINELRENKLYSIDHKCVNLLFKTTSIRNALICDDTNNNIINNDILYRISSKSFSNPNGLFENRIKGLDDLLNNINFTTRQKFINIDDLELSFKWLIVSFYIIAGQVFSDGNHRSCCQYLLSQGFTHIKVSNIIKRIDYYIYISGIEWSNIHIFIQKLIDKIISLSICENCVEDVFFSVVKKLVQKNNN